MKAQKIYIKTFGCQMNKSDSEKLLNLLENHGYQETKELQEANIIVVNTCSVREHAVKRLKSYLYLFNKLKKNNPSLLIAVGGCVAQQEKENLIKELPFIDIVFGTHNYHFLPQLLEHVKSGERGITCIINEPLVENEFILPKRESNFHSWVTIITGCSNFCSYCIVPYVRGKEISRSKDSILKEISTLVNDGVISITLLGQNVDSYGKDLTPTYSLAKLLQDIHNFEELKCIRFLTSHPKDITTELIDTVAALPKIGKFFHFPLQSGDNTILKLMNRGYTVEYYEQLIEEIRNKIYMPTITSDVIVGFPGETEEQFLNTVEAIKKFKFDSVNTASYSPRPFTEAAKMENKIPEKEKQERLNYINRIVNEVAYSCNQKFIGTTLECIVEEYNNRRMTYKARSFSNKIIHFSSNLKDLIGKIVKVKILDISSHCLFGELDNFNL